MKSLGSQTKRFLVKVPELIERPVIGAGCCVYPAVEAIAESLLETPGVRLAVPTAAEDELVVELELTGTAEVDQTLKRAVTAVRGLGYDVVSFTEDRAVQGHNGLRS